MNAERWLVIGFWTYVAAMVAGWALLGATALVVGVIAAVVALTVAVLIQLSIDLWRGDA